MPSSSLRTALLSIHSLRSSSSSTLASTTHNILRTSLAENHGMEWTNEEWKQGGGRKQVSKVWEEILQENLPQTSQITIDSSSPVIISKPISKKPSKKPSSKPIKESDEEGEEEEEEEEVTVVEVPKKKKRKISSSTDEGMKKDKYSRAAEKNLGNFMGMIGEALGDALGLGDADEEEEEEGDEASSDVMILSEGVQDENDSEDSSSTPQPQPLAKLKPTKSRSSTSSNAEASTSTIAPKKKSKRTSEGMEKPKKRRVSKGKGKEDSYKSTEFVGDSDDSSHSIDREVPKKEKNSSSKSKGNGKNKEVVDSDDSDSNREEKGKGKGKGKGKELKMTTTRTRKEPFRKEGDAEKGTELEESRIKQMKVLLKHAGTTRPFTASTGAERTLSAEERSQHLEGLLDGLGLIAKVKGKGSKGGERKLASESKAKNVGHLRELEKETEALQGSAIHTGLRTGKALHPDTCSDDDDDKKGKGKSGRSGKKGGGTPQRKKLEERKKFASFLGDQSESD